MGVDVTLPHLGTCILSPSEVLPTTLGLQEGFTKDDSEERTGHMCLTKVSIEASLTGMEFNHSHCGEALL